MKILEVVGIPERAAAAAGLVAGDGRAFADQMRILGMFGEGGTRLLVPALQRLGHDARLLPVAGAPLAALARALDLPQDGPDWGLAAIGAFLRQWQPDIIVTCGPGAYLAAPLRRMTEGRARLFAWPTVLPAQPQPWDQTDGVLLAPGLPAIDGAARVERLAPLWPSVVAAGERRIDVLYCGDITLNDQLVALTRLGRAPLGFGGEFEPVYRLASSSESWPCGTLMYDQGPAWGRDRQALQAASRLVVEFASPLLADRLLEIAACGAVPLVPAGTALPDGFAAGVNLACFDGPAGLEDLVYQLLAAPGQCAALAAGAQPLAQRHAPDAIARRFLELVA